jgi:hypothetical protein
MADNYKTYRIEFAAGITADMVVDALETLNVAVYFMPDRWPGVVEAELSDYHRNQLALQDEVAAIDRA